MTQHWLDLIYQINYSKSVSELPAAQHPNTRPCISGAALVIFKHNHPSAVPMINVKSTFNGMNHLQSS